MAQSTLSVSTPSPIPAIGRAFVSFVGPGGGAFVRKPLSGGEHLSILLEAVNVVPFSIFRLRYAYLDSFRYFYAV